MKLKQNIIYQIGVSSKTGKWLDSLSDFPRNSTLKLYRHLVTSRPK